MKYVCLVWFEPGAFDGLTEAEGTQLTDDTIEHDHRLRAGGNLIISQPLGDRKDAVTVKVRHGKVSTHDGPFIETKEWLGGFYVIEARDLDEALAIVREDPIARVGSVEIRPALEQTHSRTGQARPAPAGT
jgi:hypothetical protein